MRLYIDERREWPTTSQVAKALSDLIYGRSSGQFAVRDVNVFSRTAGTHLTCIGPLLCGMGKPFTHFTSACSGPVVAMVWEGLDVVKGECQALLVPHTCAPTPSSHFW